jgi:hypothetical protein
MLDYNIIGLQEQGRILPNSYLALLSFDDIIDAASNRRNL